MPFDGYRNKLFQGFSSDKIPLSGLRGEHLSETGFFACSMTK